MAVAPGDLRAGGLDERGDLFERHPAVVVVDADFGPAAVAAHVHVGDAGARFEQLFEPLEPAELVRLARNDDAERELAGVAAGFSRARADGQVFQFMRVVVMMIMVMAVVMIVITAGAMNVMGVVAVLFVVMVVTAPGAVLVISAVFVMIVAATGVMLVAMLGRLVTVVSLSAVRVFVRVAVLAVRPVLVLRFRLVVVAAAGAVDVNFLVR
jgi:hypothetical protein